MGERGRWRLGSPTTPGAVDRPRKLGQARPQPNRTVVARRNSFVLPRNMLEAAKNALDRLIVYGNTEPILTIRRGKAEGSSTLEGLYPPAEC